MIACPHRPPCPGCPRYGESGLAASTAAQLSALAARAGLPPPALAEGQALGYRHRARLAVRGRARSPKIGIFQRASHRVVDTPQCRIHHPRINEVAAAARRAIVATRTEPYREGPHRGDLRYLQIVIERSSARAQIVLVGNDSSPVPLDPLARALSAELGGAVHSLWWNGQPARGNAILGPHWRRWSGPEAIVERMAGVDVFHPPGAFGQSHPELLDRIALRVQAFIAPGSSVAEFYAGCGVFGLGLLARGDTVALNERSDEALRGLALGLEQRPAAERARGRVAPGPAGEALGLLADCEVVLVNPPRRGLDLPLLDALAARPPARLVYVSCGLDSLTREADVLLKSGAMRLTALEAFALFPYTEHVETLAVFDRQGR